MIIKRLRLAFLLKTKCFKETPTPILLSKYHQGGESTQASIIGHRHLNHFYSLLSHLNRPNGQVNSAGRRLKDNHHRSLI